MRPKRPKLHTWLQNFMTQKTCWFIDVYLFLEITLGTLRSKLNSCLYSHVIKCRGRYIHSLLHLRNRRLGNQLWLKSIFGGSLLSWKVCLIQSDFSGRPWRVCYRNNLADLCTVVGSKLKRCFKVKLCFVTELHLPYIEITKSRTWAYS